MNFANIFQQGNKLGMFNYGQPQAFDFRQSPGFLNLPKEKQQALEEADIKSQIEARATGSALAPYLQQPYTLDELGRFREQEARRAQELGKESLREAAKYSMLTSLPKTISQSFGNIAAMNLLGSQAATDTFARTLASYPRAQFSTYQFQPEKYFG